MRPRLKLAETFRAEVITAFGFAMLGAVAYRITLEHGLLRTVAAWPAAGFALAAVCAWGYRVLPAVFLGSVVARVGFGRVDLVPAAILSLASTVQSGLGAWVLGRWERTLPETTSLRQAAARLVVAATIGSAIAPVVEVALSPAFRAGATEFAYLAVYRWSAEAVGAMVALPLSLLWMARRRLSVTNLVVTSAVLAAVLVGIVAFFQVWNRSEKTAIHDAFTRRSLSVGQAIRRHMNLSFESVRSIAQFFDAKGPVDRAEFSKFVAPYFARNSLARAFEWVERVPEPERRAFEARMRRDGANGFGIHRAPWAGPSESYPVTYIEPLAGNESALGYDVLGTPGAVENLRRARDTGRISLSVPFMLVQEVGDQRGAVVYYPVYRGRKTPTTVLERRERLRGVVGGVFRMGDLAASAIGEIETAGLEIRLSAVTGNGGWETLFERIPSADEVRTSYTRSSFFAVENQGWHLVTTLTTRALRPNRRPAFWLLPIGGTLGAGIAIFLILILTGRSGEIEALIVERTMELRRALRVRDDFILAASHELKTPLTPLRLQVDFLVDLAARGKIGEFAAGPEFEPLLQSLGGEVERYSRLVEDLLDFSRLSSGKLVLKREACDLAAIVREVVASFAGELDRAGCSIRSEVRGSTTGNWDPIRVRQVVVNLLSNAMKYGGGGPVELRVSGEGEKTLLSVADHGIGIAEADRERIFDRFVRAVPIQNFGGLGLGLFIVRELVLAHGGTIAVESALGKGSTFTVELPNG